MSPMERNGVPAEPLVIRQGTSSRIIRDVFGVLPSSSAVPSECASICHGRILAGPCQLTIVGRAKNVAADTWGTVDPLGRKQSVGEGYLPGRCPSLDERTPPWGTQISWPSTTDEESGSWLWIIPTSPCATAQENPSTWPRPRAGRPRTRSSGSSHS